MRSLVKASVVSVVLLILLAIGIYVILQGRKEGKEREGEVPEIAESKPQPKPEAKEEKPVTKPFAAPPSVDLVPLTVRVMGKETKRLLPNSSIRIQKSSEGDRPGETVYDSGRKGGASSTGEFQVPPLPPALYVLRAECKSYTSQLERVKLVKEKPQTVVLELERGNTISGRVLTKDNRGIGGASVFAYHQIGEPQQSLIEKIIGITEIQNWQNEPIRKTESLEDGSYVIDGLEKKYYTVKAVADGFAPGERENIYPTKDGVNVQLPKGGEISGVVVDASGGGVEGAKIMAYNHIDTQDIIKIIETRSRPPMDTATSGAGGAFAFKTLGAGMYNFLVSANCYQEGKFLKVRVREGENAPLRFPISRGLLISGTVVTSTNEPIPGARVRAVKAGDTGKAEQMFIKFEDTSIPTDKDGRFSFCNLETGKYTILVWHQNYATEQLRDMEAGSENLTITLPTGGAISGQITEAGTKSPIAGARITVSDMQDLKKEDVTDDQGMYLIAGLNAASQSKRFLNIQADGYARQSNVQVYVKDNEITENQNFELQKTAMVTGRVVDTKGGPVAGVRVLAKRKSGSAGVAMTVGSAVTDSGGQYKISEIEAGDGTELVTMEGEYLEGKSNPFSIQPGQSIEVPDIVLQLGGMVQGVVVGPEGRGIEGVQVAVLEEGKTMPDPALSTSSDHQGKFLLKGLKSGAVNLVAKSNHYLDSDPLSVTVEEGKITKDVRFVLRKGAHVKGTVVDGAGQPIRGVQVIVQDISPSGMKELPGEESGQDGSFLVENILSQDKVEVTFKHPDYEEWGTEVPVNSEDLKVVLRKLGGVRGAVVDSQGKPLVSFTVVPTPKGQGKSPGEKTFSNRADGSFEYAGIPPGIYSISVRSPNHASFSYPDVEVGSEVLDVGRATLQEGGMLSGIVVDQSGQPVAGATVRAKGGLVQTTSQSPGSGTAKTDARGAFQLQNLKGGNVGIQVMAPGYVTKSVDNLEISSSNQSQPQKIILELGAEISGIVTDAQGNTKPGVSVSIQGDKPNTSQRTMTDNEGKFLFKGLQAGNYTVTAVRLGGDPGVNPSVAVSINAGDQQPVELVFE